jgi:CRISPR-associated protein Csd1
MILQELVSYYDRKRCDPDSGIAPPGWVRRGVDYVISLDDDGSSPDLASIFELVKGKPVGRPTLLPEIGKQARKHTMSGTDSNLLWDNAGFVLGIGERGDMKLESFVETLDHWLADDADVAVRAVRVFANALLSDRSIAARLIAKAGAKEDFAARDPVIAFRLVSDGPYLVHEREAVRRAFEARRNELDADARKGRCLVSGDEGVPLALNETVIKGVWGAQTSGANLVSFNAASFASYGKFDRPGASAPIGRAASFAYSTVLNELLASKRNRIQVGDASTVFWADRPSRFDGEFTLADFFGEHNDDPDRGVRAVQALYEAIGSGKLPVAEGDATFFVLGLAPNAARLSVRFWLRASLADLAPRIARHFDDLRVVRRFDSDPAVPSIFRLVSSLAPQGKVDRAPPRLAGEWMRAILEGLPYPATLLNESVVRCKAEQEVTYLRAAVLKAWLNRDHRRRYPGLGATHSEFKEELDMDQPDVPYRLGRLFALLERVQQQAQPGINATIRDRYYGAASTTPVAVFTTLLRLKNAHLKKLGEGAEHFFERQIGEVLESISDFPRHLTLPEQGRFALGYYHQRQSFFKHHDATKTTSPEP